jgi:hypothetical protein
MIYTGVPMAPQRSYKIPKRFDNGASLKALLAASAGASTLGIAVLDSQTRFEAVNEALARETRASVDFHIGRTSHEVVGDLASQIEPTYENVLRGGTSSSVPLVGRIRDDPDTGYWLDHCFPIRNQAGAIQQLGLFVVNVTAERASAEIFQALAVASPDQIGPGTAIVRELEQIVSAYHDELSLTLDELVSSYAEPGRKVELFRSSLQQLDNRIRNMRELVYNLTSRFVIPSC